MKKFNFSLIIVIIMIMIAIFSCSKSHKNVGPGYGRGQSLRVQTHKDVSKFKKGDVIYLKPDSLKVVVLKVCPCSKNTYVVYWFDVNGHKQQMDVDEQLIY